MNIRISEEDYKRAAENGINKDNLYNRINNLFWTMEKATTQPIKKHQKKSKHGKWLEVARENGIYAQLFQSRKRLGWDSERAATKKAGKRGVKVN